ncbi:hypothetical protein BOTU111922_20060 [Bordetella tumulicola]
MLLAEGIAVKAFLAGSRIGRAGLITSARPDQGPRSRCAGLPEVQKASAANPRTRQKLTVIACLRRCMQSSLHTSITEDKPQQIQ